MVGPGARKPSVGEGIYIVQKAAESTPEFSLHCYFFPLIFCTYQTIGR